MEGQNIYQGNVTLTTQAEIDTFGANNYTQINGNVRIEGVSAFEITDLSSLSSFEVINGKLDLFNNENLLSLSGLENLTSISDWLIMSNIGVTDLLGLANLTSVNQLEIVNMPNLQSLNGLQNITSINWIVQISANPNLNSLNGLNNLVSTEATFSITLNHSLIDLQGLDSFTSVNNNYGLTVGNNNNLQSLNGISQLTTVGGISVSNNGLLNDFCDLTNLLTNGTYTAYSIVNNDYNPTTQDIIDGNCSTQIPILEITYPKAGDHYIEGRNLRLQIGLDIALPENQQFDIGYSTDGGITWVSGGNLNTGTSSGGFWLLPSVSEPKEFLVKLETNLSGNVVEILSNSFTVQPEDYYLDDGFSNTGISQIEFTLQGGLNKWEETFNSGVHNCMDNYAQDWEHNRRTCGKRIRFPYDGVIISVKKNVTNILGLCGGFNDGNYGKQIVIQSLKDKTIAIRFAHLMNIKRSWKVGDTISRYDVIGRVGGSGTLEAHLHASLYKNIYEWLSADVEGVHYDTIFQLLTEEELSITESPNATFCEQLRDNYSGEFEFVSNLNSRTLESDDSSNTLVSHANNLIKIFPNPLKEEKISIENLTGFEILKIKIFNSKGQEVFKINKPQSQFIVPKYTDGIYFIKCYLADTEQTIVSKKIVINN